MNYRQKLLLPFFLSVFLIPVYSDAQKNERQKERPNILIAISDDQSYPYAGAYGNKTVQTPAFDRVAEEGILFTNAFVASPGCAPSRSSILTGRFPWQNEEAGGHQTLFPKEYKVYPDVLEENGYFIGYTGKGCAPFNWRQSGRTRNPAGNVYNNIDYPSREGIPTEGIRNTNYAANFEAFMNERPQDQPFYFWYGASEPHRKFEEGSGLRMGKKLEDAYVPGFLPDDDVIRKDVLDYVVEIDWFDLHLKQMMDYLESIGELDNTIILVTSDNGMAFPRAKANNYEYGIHVPLAVQWPATVKGDRVVDDLISLADICPTIFDITGIEPTGMKEMSAKSFKNILFSKASGIVDPTREAVYSSRERHSSARWANLGYPIRSIRTQKYLYIRNFRPERWPAGAPQSLKRNDPTQSRPMYDLSDEGKFMGEAFYDIDAALSKSHLIENHDKDAIAKYFHLAVDKRPGEELYDITKDPDCLNNLATNEEYGDVLKALSNKLDQFLIDTEDPRMVGPNPNIFENYQRFFEVRPFPDPGWIKVDY